MSKDYGGYTGRDRCINCGGLLPEELRERADGVACLQVTGERCT